jgi:signal transduction histidine kinase
MSKRVSLGRWSFPRFLRTEEKSSRHSLAGRLIWLAAAWIVAALVGMGAILTTVLHGWALRQLNDANAATIKELAALIEIAKDGTVEAPELMDPQTHAIFSGKYWQVAELTPAGKIESIARSKSLWDQDLAPPPDIRPLKSVGEEVHYDAHGPLKEQRLRVEAQTVILPGRPQPLILMASIDRRRADSDVERTATLTWIVLLLMSVAVVAAVVVQVRVGLRPLFRLEREIADARKGKILRLAGDYPKEIAPLAEELNALLDHNREVVERQRSHVGNLAHALKTPIAVMLSEAERGGPALAEVVGRQTAAMRAHVEHHLRRARAAARAQNLGERTAVEPVLDELASLLERVFQDKGVTIDWRAPEDLEFRGERQDLQEVAGNILENACKWCRARVRAVAEPSPGTGTLRLIVEDDGPGLPEDRREEVLKRGARLDESAPGSGLGLSIVDELARAYGGRVELGRSTLGGLKVEVRLPAAEA